MSEYYKETFIKETSTCIPANIFTNIFNIRISEECRIHVLLHDYIASKFNEVIIKEEPNIEERYKHIIPILILLRIV